jgi:hypothetical protein
MPTKRSIVHFAAPFSLKGIDGTLAPGDYEVDQDEEQIEGISWLAYRRVGTFIHLPAIGSKSRTSMMVAVDPAELDAALERDHQHAAADAGSGPA